MTLSPNESTSQKPDNGSLPYASAWPVPYGWFSVGRGSELKKRAVKPIRYFGKDLVLFRTESGDARVFDANCMHNGSHLGYGGRVEGDCITCPMHRWKFASEDGRCVHIPYLKKGQPIPSRRMRTWNVHETHDLIFVWHGPGDGAPLWAPPRLSTGAGHRAATGSVPNLRGDRSRTADDWYPLQEFRVDIECGVQTVIENVVDGPHLDPVHQGGRVGEVTLEEHGPILYSQWNGVQMDKMDRFPFNLLVPPFEDNRLDSELHGMGFFITRFNAAGNEFLLMMTVSPIEDNRTDLRAFTSVRRARGLRSVGSRIANFAYHQAVKYEVSVRDKLVWDHQKYWRKPVFTKSDTMFVGFRQWAKQFYPSRGAGNGAEA